jgi:hypothetical protein
MDLVFWKAVSMVMQAVNRTVYVALDLDPYHGMLPRMHGLEIALYILALSTQIHLVLVYVMLDGKIQEILYWITILLLFKF